jgi:hypothetical protein
VLWLVSLQATRLDIRNSRNPSCRNCVHFQPNPLFFDFGSEWNTCKKFGEVNLVSNHIDYDLAKECRRDETKCGLAGRGWERQPFMELKLLRFWFLKAAITVFLSICFTNWSPVK